MFHTAKPNIAQKKLLALIKKLAAIRGRHTELITIYVPAGSNLNIVADQVKQEQGTASNIKSKTVRKNVLGALEKINQHLKHYRQTPPNGLALFCGNVSEKEGESDLELWAFEPPERLNQRLYRCDQEFVLDPLAHMVREREIYGLVVLDKSEAEIGTLKGKRVESLKHLESLVPGKTKKGGWCVHEDTLIQLADGRIEKVKDLKDDEFLCYDFNKLGVAPGRHAHFFSRNSDDALRIRTSAPTSEIVVTPEHKFFIANEDGFGTKDAADIRPGDRLLAVKSLAINGVKINIDVKLPFRYQITEKGLRHLVKRREELGLYQWMVARRVGISQTAISKLELGERTLKLANLNKILDMYGIGKSEFFDNFVIKENKLDFTPELNRDLAQLLGYMLGDGNRDKNRITFSERELPTLKIYERMVQRLFSISARIKPRVGKGYYEMRIHNKFILSLIEREFPGILTPCRKDIPDNVCKSRKPELGGFIRGLFDAEGWIDKKAKILGITMNNREVINKVRLILLRWGIVSSLREVKRKGSFARKMRYNLRITDAESLREYSKSIGFSSARKRKELIGVVVKSNVSYVDQIPISGRHLLNLVHKLGLTTGDFPKVQDFFYDRKGMSYRIFKKNIYDIVRRKFSGSNESEELSYMKSILDSDMISVVVKSVDAVKTNRPFYDMHVPGFNSFIANGFVLHNSQARYARVREGLLNDHMKKTGEIATSYFREMRDLKGIIIGGPGPIKDMFFNGGFLPTDVKSKVLGVVDTSYTGKFGLNEILERGEDILAEASVTAERKLLERFFSELAKDSGLGVYGLKETMKALESGAVEILLVSESFDWVHAQLECPSCGAKLERMVRRDRLDSVKCPKCGASMEAGQEEDAIEKLADAAEKVDTTLEIVSVDTREGEQLFEMGGIAGILRYRV
ncbi:MAG: helix-turn-helix domain-containing protein [Candidatus Aenigmarchaeota archaeon]|nr:helix-turn-helix domain-containing protein [Candidatus Aenigmarchaeota archaeon]